MKTLPAMSYKLPATSYQRGVTLIDTIVGTALMLVVFMGISAAFQLSVEVVSNNKARAGAIALANERMEYLKSLSYSQIGVIGGIPAGNVQQLESVPLNSVSYTRRTMVFYNDDPGDGIGAADTNHIVADYKTIRVEVSWNAKQGERSVTLVGRVSPPGIESAVPGGTLTVKVVDALNAPLYNAQVDIANTGTVPAINIRTYTNVLGEVSFIGAPAASNYQITASRAGYSTDRTNPVTAENPNPDPRHITVANDQTSTANLAIDLLSTKIVQTFKQIVPVTWTDPLSNSNLVATSTHISIAGGDAHLSGSSPYPESGRVLSESIAPTILAGWDDVSWTDTTPVGTDILYRVYDMTSGNPIIVAESALAGNTAGFSSSPVDLSGLSTTTYRALALEATFSSDTTATPSLNSWSLSYDFGPEPLPNFSFTMRGAKTIGNNPVIYKYNQTHATGAGAELVINGVEWDTYTLAPAAGSAYEIAESCAPQPEALAPASTQTTRLYLLPNTANSVLVDVRSNTGTLLDGASVRVQKGPYDTTVASSACGQAFFPGLAGGVYTVTASKVGYQSASSTPNVSGDMNISITLLPL